MLATLVQAVLNHAKKENTSECLDLFATTMFPIFQFFTVSTQEIPILFWQLRTWEMQLVPCLLFTLFYFSLVGFGEEMFYFVFG